MIAGSNRLNPYDARAKAPVQAMSVERKNVLSPPWACAGRNGPLAIVSARTAGCTARAGHLYSRSGRPEVVQPTCRSSSAPRLSKSVRYRVIVRVARPERAGGRISAGGDHMREHGEELARPHGQRQEVVGADSTESRR